MITRETVEARQEVSFYFDPICPWTWITSRWLVEVAEARGLQINWRTFSLSTVNGGIDRMPERFREAARFSLRAERVIEAMRTAGENRLVGEFYTELGRRLHVVRARPDATLLEEAAAAVGAQRFLPTADEDTWDVPVVQSTDQAVALAGPDVGSPVLAMGERGLYGPIVSPAPAGQEALRLWDAIETLFALPSFYELKHGRVGEPKVEVAAPSERRETSTGRRVQ